MSEPLILTKRYGSTQVISLNRPEKRNALSRALLASLSDSIGHASSDTSLRSLVLTNNGPTFCAGMDLSEAGDPRASEEAERNSVRDMQAIADVMDQIHNCPLPTIAAVCGDALAGGAGLALACDFVLMADTARIGFPEVRRGLVAAIVLHDLVRHVGDRRSRDLLLTGRTIRAEQAKDWGLINSVVAAEDCFKEALSFAESLLNTAPIAVKTTKKLLDEASGMPIDLRGAAAVSAAIRVGDEAREGMAAFVEKRRTSWDKYD